MFEWNLNRILSILLARQSTEGCKLPTFRHPLKGVRLTGTAISADVDQHSTIHSLCFGGESTLKTAESGKNSCFDCRKNRTSTVFSELFSEISFESRFGAG